MDHLLELLGPTRDLPTPFVAIDGIVMRGNIAAMGATASAAGVNLRPHIKTHKASALARAQLAHGAVGVTVATLSEAVALGRAGVSTDVLVALPVVIDRAHRPLLDEAAELHERLTVAADSEPILEALREVPPSVGIAIEVDSGLNRTGADPATAARLAAGIDAHRLWGFFTHGGHAYAPGAAKRVAAEEVGALEAAWTAIGSPGGCELSAGSTPTRRMVARRPVTEIRPGTYVFGDHQQVVLGAVEPGEVACAVVSTVVHVGPGRLVVDAGTKSLSKDRPDFLESYGHVVGNPGLVIDRLNENHGMVSGDPGGLAVGDRVAIVPDHVCTVINLFDSIWDVEGDEIERLDVDLRGRQW